MLYDPLLEVVLYHPEIPHNTGAIGRTCVAIGARLWLVRPLGFQVDDRYLRRASLDYWQHLEYEVADDWDDLKRKLHDRRFWFLSKHAERIYTEPTFERGDALVFGCESQGMPDSFLRDDPDQALRIPMRPETRCLNLSVSAGIVCYEAYRQLTVS